MALTDYQTQQTAQTGINAGQQAQVQQNTYTPGQQGLQDNLGGFYNQLLQGNIPQSYTAPQPLVNAFNSDFDQNVAPGIASQFGPGSNQIGSQHALALQQMLGNQYNLGVGNYMNALGGATNYAQNPTGSASTGTNAGTQAQSGTNDTTINPLFYMLMQSLGNSVSGGIQNAFGGP